MRLEVTVVIPTCRRNDLLRRCLAALAQQTLAAEQFEVIVVDDAGSASTKAMVDQFAASSRLDLHYAAAPRQRGPAAARNQGWRLAHAPVVAFTDDDCVPAEAWLAAGVAAMELADAVAGEVIVPLPDRPTDYERDAAGLSSAEFVTANCFCRRGVLDAIGGFDERFELAWREDSDLQFALLEQGYRIVHCPRARVVHPVRPAPWGASLRQQRKSQFDALLYKKHPQLYRQRIARFPWEYYAIATVLCLLAIAWIGGSSRGVLLSSAAWTGLTAEFCTRRLQGTSRAPGHVLEMVLTSALIPVMSLYWHLRGWLRFRVCLL